MEQGYEVGRGVAPLSSGGCRLEDVLATHVLSGRPTRGADYALESRALTTIADGLTSAPDTVAQRLVDLAQALTGAHAAGLSIEDKVGEEVVFRWAATSGELSALLGQTLPRYDSPCGSVFETRSALLMREPARYFPYIEQLGKPINEVLLAPFFEDGSPVGTLWVLSLLETKLFDAEDLRLLQSLSTLAGVMVHTSTTMRALKVDRERKDRLLDDQETALKTMTSLFDQAPGLMAVLKGPSHRFEMANQAYYDFVGQRDIIGKPVFEALPEAKGQGFEELLDNVFQSGHPYVGRSVPIQLQRTPNGPPASLYVDFVYQPIHGASGTTQGIFVQGHDVTDREVALKALEDADSRKDAFLATLAHELRNPLGPIRIATQLLGRSVPESQQPVVAVIDRQSAVLTTLVNELMDVASIRSGKISLVRHWTSVQDILAGAMEVVRPLLDARRHTFSVEMPEKRLPLFADPLRLTQVLTNLLTNAAKYTPDEGSIAAVVMDAPDEIAISVRDSGIGIDAAMLPKVFEMFSQSAQSLNRSEGGLGIGLALVRQLVELHGGRVVAHSAGAGEGSTFTVHLPKTQDETL